MTAPYAGGCPCGQVRWRANAEPINVRLCHCSNCQRATGGPYFARILFHAAAVEREGATTRWASSQRLHRLSCANCGAPMFADVRDGPYLAVALASLDEPDGLEPGSHIWVSEKRPWVIIDDGLPQFPRGA